MKNSQMHTRIMIDGEWRDADDGRTISVHDPADDRILAEVPACGATETRAAIAAASQAQGAFATLPTPDRAELLRAISRGIDARREALAELITLEGGKPLAEAQAEVQYGRSFFDQAAEDLEAMSDEEVRLPEKRVRILKRPIGVTASIVAWNFPLALLAKKVAPAFAVGCTHVVKPSELTPLTTLAFAAIVADAGMPPGVFNVVTGQPDEIGEVLLSDARVGKLSFTGSTRVGRLLIRNSATNITRLSLELGGHAPFLVFADSDLEDAVDVAVRAKFRNGGQTCICPNRFLVERNVHDEFVERLADRIQGLRSGRGTEEGVDLGPQINDAGADKVRRHCLDAVEQGGTLVCGGGRRSLDGLADRFPEPTIVTGLNAKMQCWSEETFGPLCPVRAFDTEDEAIGLANDSAYGLASYACTRDRDRIERLFGQLQTGIIGLNDPGPAIAAIPVGGIKASGYGREGGRWAFNDYLSTIAASERIPGA